MTSHFNFLTRASSFESNSLTLAVTLIFKAQFANFKVEMESSNDKFNGLRVAISTVFVYPPRESFKSLVSLDSL